MIIADRSSAEAFLSHVNYYRFSGYVLAFERSRHAFVPGTTFEQVRDAYEFDRVLRDLVTESLELVEVDARTAIGYHFGRSYGAFGHTEPANFFATFRHRDWIDKLNAEATRSNEQFVRHYRRTYSGFPDLPAWIATEVMSFGAISIMFRGMRRDDQREIARRYRIQPGFLASWLHHLVYVRNVCAHHSRVWDRVWAIKPDLPPLPAWSSPLLPGNDRLFVTLLILRRLLARCPSIAPFDAAWKSRVERHLSVPPDVADPLIRMGLHRDWKSHPLWA
ncbi:MAG: Abi family protein [Phycisphaerales bacterium]|jgi:abortive infection bacteriophage resistance protein